VFNSDMRGSSLSSTESVFHIVIDRRISTIDHLICIGSSERKLILVTTDFFITFS